MDLLEEQLLRKFDQAKKELDTRMIKVIQEQRDQQNEIEKTLLNTKNRQKAF